MMQAFCHLDASESDEFPEGYHTPDARM